MWEYDFSLTEREKWLISDPWQARKGFRMMSMNVDLYGYFGTERGSAEGGSLQCLMPGQPLADRKRPAILVLPGGGYYHTSAREGEPVALRFAAAGYAAFVLHYSCAPTARYPVALREAAMAMRYIRQNADAFGVDSRMVAALGFSAGGHLCGCLGTLFDSQVVSDLGGPELLRPDALCLCYPVTVSWGRTHEGSFRNLCGDDEELRQRLSLERLVRPDMPPVFLWHTRSDGSVPCVGSLILARAIEETGVDFAMHIYRRGVHGLATGGLESNPPESLTDISPDVSQWMEACIGFLGEIGFGISEERKHV